MGGDDETLGTLLSYEALGSIETVRPRANPWRNFLRIPRRLLLHVKAIGDRWLVDSRYWIEIT